MPSSPAMLYFFALVAGSVIMEPKVKVLISLVTILEHSSPPLPPTDKKPVWSEETIIWDFPSQTALLPFSFPHQTLCGAFKDCQHVLWTFFHNRAREVLQAWRPVPRANINIYNYSSQLILNQTWIWPPLRRHCLKQHIKVFIQEEKLTKKRLNASLYLCFSLTK